MTLKEALKQLEALGTRGNNRLQRTVRVAGLPLNRAVSRNRER
jgi:hypothetical protein